MINQKNEEESSSEEYKSSSMILSDSNSCSVQSQIEYIDDQMQSFDLAEIEEIIA